MGALFLVSSGASYCSLVAAPTYTPTNSVGFALFSIPSPAFTVCELYDDSHSGWYEVIL